MLEATWFFVYWYFKLIFVNFFENFKHAYVCTPLKFSPTSFFFSTLCPFFITYQVCFWNKASNGAGWPWTYYVAEVDFKLVSIGIARQLHHTQFPCDAWTTELCFQSLLFFSAPQSRGKWLFSVINFFPAIYTVLSWRVIHSSSFKFHPFFIPIIFTWSRGRRMIKNIWFNLVLSWYLVHVYLVHNCMVRMQLWFFGSNWKMLFLPALWSRFSFSLSLVCNVIGRQLTQTNPNWFCAQHWLRFWEIYYETKQTQFLVQIRPNIYCLCTSFCCCCCLYLISALYPSYFQLARKVELVNSFQKWFTYMCSLPSAK